MFIHLNILNSCNYFRLAFYASKDPIINKTDFIESMNYNYLFYVNIVIKKHY